MAQWALDGLAVRRRNLDPMRPDVVRKAIAWIGVVHAVMQCVPVFIAPCNVFALPLLVVMMLMLFLLLLLLLLWCSLRMARYVPSSRSPARRHSSQSSARPRRSRQRARAAQPGDRPHPLTPVASGSSGRSACCCGAPRSLVPLYRAGVDGEELGQHGWRARGCQSLGAVCWARRPGRFGGGSLP